MELIRCPHCGATNHKSESCRRCGLDITLDRRSSLQRSLAFFLSALIFYIPANIYPILQSSRFGSFHGSTIIEGVFQLWRLGDYPVAIVIFLASILVPLMKFVILLYLITTIAMKRCGPVKWKVRLYYLIEITGPWSLIDVFVVVILTALIHFKNIAIIPGIGVSSFALMVFFTILSANALDVRLIGADCEE